MKPMLLAFAFCCLLASSAFADVPDTFTNLKVLPKNTDKEQLMDVMRSFSMSLGLRCIACHEIKTPGDYSTIDWASDKEPMKDVARGMMKMTGEINRNLLPAATGEHDFQVRCITCHRGVKKPLTLDQVMLHAVEKDGADAAAQEYRNLREEYYGSGSYDFRAGTLNHVAETLAQKKNDPQAARLMAQLNLEMNPDDPTALLLLAQLDLADGRKDDARANIEKVLKAHPDHRHALRLQQQLGR